jgi:8-oxo-dGTP pyrophosphatase MutT (NUDIX family)
MDMSSLDDTEEWTDWESLRETAQRETMEEVGLDLKAPYGADCVAGWSTLATNLSMLCANLCLLLQECPLDRQLAAYPDASALADREHAR